MNLPPLASTILYSNTLYQVRDRTRNKTTRAITLWLCHCADINCQHTKQPAPLQRFSIE